MNISSVDARSIYTKKLVAVFKDRIAPTNFLEGFFPTTDKDITDSLMVSVQAQRITEKVATDVVRGTDGNRNKFTRSTENIFLGPYYREYFDQTNMQVYERTFYANEVSDNELIRLINDTADHSMELQEKIQRKLELQRVQILTTGIMTMAQGAGQITFQRRPQSLVDLSVSAPWTGAGDPYVAISNAGDFLRKFGKVAPGRLIVIMGSEAKAALMNNAIFKVNQGYFNMKLDSVVPPEKQSGGAIYHGVLTAGNYMAEIWTYPAWYEDAAGTMVDYLDPKKIIVLPSTGFQAKTVYAAVPQLLQPGQRPTRAKFHLNEYVDEKARTREYHVESAGMPILVSVDRVYTAKVVA